MKTTTQHCESGIRWLLGLGLALAAATPVLADETAEKKDWILAVGLMAHDVGFFSDRKEDLAPDLNLELQFAAFDFITSPRLMVGLTANFTNETSAAYAGLTLYFLETTHWFIDGSASAALHNGPLHKDPYGCLHDSDCGYGIRVMPRFSLEAGYRINPESAVSLFWDHMSHKDVIPGENEGLEHSGLRYLHTF